MTQVGKGMASRKRRFASRVAKLSRFGVMVTYVGRSNKGTEGSKLKKDMLEVQALVNKTFECMRI